MNYELISRIFSRLLSKDEAFRNFQIFKFSNFQILLFLSVFLVPLVVQSQNLYDYEHSKRFADYLFKSQQYQLAADEYERVVFLNPTDNNAKINLIQSYRFNKNYSLGIKRVETLFPDSLLTLKPVFAEEYIKLLILNNSKDSITNYLTINQSLSNERKNDYRFRLLLLNQKWSDANNFFKTNRLTTNKNNVKMLIFSDKTKEIKYKSPLVATTMSMVIPGSGKFYTKNWKDGLLSFIIVAANSWQSYRGFSKYGQNSAYGWIFGTLAVGFYGGNVYGTYKAAKKYNQRLDDKYCNEVKQLIYNE